MNDNCAVNDCQKRLLEAEIEQGARWRREGEAELRGEIERLRAERDELYGYVNGLLGLLQLVRGRDDMPAEIGSVLRTNHRAVDAAAYLTQIVPPQASEQSGRQCPRCSSPDPARHPAVQFEGEVQICPDPFHALGQGARNKEG